jgi:hypothetical protein
MHPAPADDPEETWIALLCAGILLTSLAGTVCLGLVAFYHAKLADVQPVLACFAAGALLMLAAAARLDHLSVGRTRIHRR